MNYTINRDGQEIGQYSEAEVRAHLASGTLLPTDLAWREGLSDWIPLAQIFSDAAPAAAPAVPTVGLVELLFQ
jgi:hypothetical protein